MKEWDENENAKSICSDRSEFACHVLVWSMSVVPINTTVLHISRLPRQNDSDSVWFLFTGYWLLILSFKKRCLLFGFNPLSTSVARFQLCGFIKAILNSPYFNEKKSANYGSCSHDCKKVFASMSLLKDELERKEKAVRSHRQSVGMWIRFVYFNGSIINTIDSVWIFE